MAENPTILDMLVDIGNRLTGIEERLKEVEATSHVQIKGADLDQNIMRLFVDARKEADALEPKCQWTPNMRDTLFC